MTFEEWFKVEYPNQHVFKESTLTCKSFYDGASVVWDYKQAEIADYEHMISGCYSDPYWIRVKQAIADVESCQ